jgi:hypothetical protein
MLLLPGIEPLSRPAGNVVAVPIEISRFHTQVG